MKAKDAKKQIGNSKGNPLLDNTPTVWDDDVVSRIRHEVLEIKANEESRSNQSDWTVRIFNHRRENNKRTIVHDLDRPRPALYPYRFRKKYHPPRYDDLITFSFDENFMDKVSEFGLFKTSRS
ncbi:hypothetical protein HID58_093055 [Brassica napus]|uniref:Uncharacterized protein n=1 Tax=Brassica napus TaxID=3708 RepID=A0ABQ7XCC2_BRANA|nr:hypothetical protein HID58_093055 [Brassica napus]